MNTQVGGLLLLVLGLALAAMAMFAWPLLARLPMNRLRARIFGPKAARIMLIVAGLLAAALGCFALIAGQT